jgi:hypothetical protein
MSRTEILARALILGGIVVGVATIAVLVGQQLFAAPAPETESLGPLLEHSAVLYERERDDLGAEKGRARSVLLAVPEASNEEVARTGLLRLLRRTGWSVSSAGGAAPPDDDVCLVVTTPTAWLSDGQNGELREDFESKLSDTQDAAVIVDAFFCR